MDIVYTPFIGGYWTKSLQMLIALHVIIYSLQLIGYLFVGENIIGEFFAVYNTRPFPYWKLFTCILVHDLWPTELVFSICVLAFMGGDLERCWGYYVFWAFYILVNILSASLRLVIVLQNAVPQYGSMAGAIGICCALAFCHPRRLIYGKIAIRQLMLMILIVIMLILLLSVRIETAIAYFIGIPMAFMLTQYFPVIRRKFMLWKLIEESNQLYYLEAIKAEVDVLLAKVTAKGLSQLSNREKQRLQRASRILKKHSKKFYGL